MQLVEAQIRSRLDTAAGQQILREEAVFYGNDIDAARAAIIRCARNKVRQRLTNAVGERQPERTPTPDGRGRGGSGGNTASAGGSNSGGSGSARSQRENTHGSNGSESDNGSLDAEIAAEAEALGLRAEDIPFAASSLAKVNMRQFSRDQPTSRRFSRGPAEAPVGDDPFSSPRISSTSAASSSSPVAPKRIGSGRGPVFGKSLEAALVCNARLPPPQNKRVPDVVQMSLDYLNKYALSTEGLWRIPGNVGRVKEYQRAWDAGVGVDYAAEETRPHDVCSLLLLYFRELPGTIFGPEMRQKFMNDQDLVSEDAIVDRLSGLVGTLPAANRDTLNAMIRHFMLLAANSSENMMTSENIATCVWASQGYYQSMKHMIDNYDLIFYMYS